jgi:hypothetical protein
MSFNPYNTHNITTIKTTTMGSFDEYDSIEGEFSLQMQTDDESMVMSELGSCLGGVSVDFRGSGGDRRTSDANDEIQHVKSEEEIYEDDTNTSYDDCASFMNSVGIPSGDVSAILFGGQSSGYNAPTTTGGYVQGLFGSHKTDDSNLNTSQDDTVGDLFADAPSVMDSVLDRYLSDKPKKLGPLGDELSYAQDDSTAAEKPDLTVDIPLVNDELLPLDNDTEEEEINTGILPLWLSSSNSRMKSMLVISAALIVGSLVMAVVALGANSHWWTDGSSSADGVAAYSSEMDERGISLEETGVPSLRPSFKPTRRPTPLPVSEETGEMIVDVSVTEATTLMGGTTSAAAAETTLTEVTTAAATDSPTVTISPSTLSPIESPTVAPSLDSLPPSGKPVTASPTLCKFVTLL